MNHKTSRAKFSSYRSTAWKRLSQLSLETVGWPAVWKALGHLDYSNGAESGRESCSLTE